VHDGAFQEKKNAWKPSQSGTFVNGARLDGRAAAWTRVAPGATVRFSKHAYVARPAAVRVCTSKVQVRDPEQSVEKLATRAGVRVVKDVARATHLIMAEGSATPKAVAALALGLPIVNLEWLVDTAAAVAPPPAEAVVRSGGSGGSGGGKAKKPAYMLPSVLLPKYRPPLATDSMDMVSPAKYYSVEGRDTIFAGDTFFVSRADSSARWLKSAIEGCGGTISFEVEGSALKRAYVFSSKKEGAVNFIAAAKKAGAEEISLSVLASAVVRSVAILQSMHLYSQSQVSQRLSQRVSSKSQAQSQQSQRDVVSPGAGEVPQVPTFAAPEQAEEPKKGEKRETKTKTKAKTKTKPLAHPLGGEWGGGEQEQEQEQADEEKEEPPKDAGIGNMAASTRKRGRDVQEDVQQLSLDDAQNDPGDSKDADNYVMGRRSTGKRRKTAAKSSAGEAPAKGKGKDHGEEVVVAEEVAEEVAEKVVEDDEEEKDDEDGEDGEDDEDDEDGGAMGVEESEEQDKAAAPAPAPAPAGSKAKDGASAEHDHNDGFIGGGDHDEDSDCACLGGEVGDYGADEDIPDSFKRPHANANGVKWLSSARTAKVAEGSAAPLVSLAAEVFEPIFIPRPPATKKATQKKKAGRRGKCFVKQHFEAKVAIPFAGLESFQQPLSERYVEMGKNFRAKEANSVASLDLFSGRSTSTVGRRRARAKRQRR
jgi:hypothetical protein